MRNGVKVGKKSVKKIRKGKESKTYRDQKLLPRLTGVMRVRRRVGVRVGVCVVDVVDVVDVVGEWGWGGILSAVCERVCVRDGERSCI